MFFTRDKMYVIKKNLVGNLFKTFSSLKVETVVDCFARMFLHNDKSFLVTCFNKIGNSAINKLFKCDFFNLLTG